MPGPTSPSTAGSRPAASWIDVEGELAAATGRLVGATPGEVTTANTLSVNLHLLLAALYRPTAGRAAILIDAPTFPSDRYVVESQLRHHGLDPAHDLIVVRPRAGEDLLRPDDLDAVIHEHRGRLALGLLAGVNYATGQALDIGRHTAALHAAGPSPCGTWRTRPATCRSCCTTTTSTRRRGAPTSTSTADRAPWDSCSCTSGSPRMPGRRGWPAGGATIR